MNESNPPTPPDPSSLPPIIPSTTSAQRPPPLPPTATPSGGQSLGDDPAEQLPIPNIFTAIDAMLRQPRRVMFQLRQPGAGRLIGYLIFISIICAAIYGVVAGAFSGSSQLWIAPAKIVLGMTISAVICLPSLYIFTCLSESQARLVEVIGLLAGLLMLMTILLVGFAPVAWIFSQSTDSVVWMGLLHLLFWAVALIFGLRFLKTGFSHTAARTSSGFVVWTGIFLLVALQMTTSLRPIIGKADTFMPTEKKFFLSYWGDCLRDQTGSELAHPGH